MARSSGCTIASDPSQVDVHLGECGVRLTDIPEMLDQRHGFIISSGSVSDSAGAVRGIGEGGPPGPSQQKERTLAAYVIYFNQQWVGDHTDAWFQGACGPPTPSWRR